MDKFRNACPRVMTMTYWKLVMVSMYPVAIQLVFCNCLSSLPIVAYEDAMIVPSIAARKIPIDIGIIYTPCKPITHSSICPYVT